MFDSSFSTLIALALALVALGGLGGCGGPSADRVEITKRRHTTVPTWRHTVGKPSSERFGNPSGMGAHGGAAAGKATQTPFAFDLPEGWEELQPTQFRLVNLRVAGNPEAECTVSTAGGGIHANLNRWLGQLGQPELTAEQIEKLPRLSLLGRDAYRLSAEGVYTGMGGPEREGYRLDGLLLDMGGGTGLFIKMVGPAAVLAAENERFEQLCSSLRLNDKPAGGSSSSSAGSSSAGSSGAASSGTETSGTETSGTAATQPTTAPTAGAGPVGSAGGFKGAALKWETPSHWQRGAERMMRLATFHPGDDTSAECIITPLPGQAGGVAENLNRWRAQLGAATLDAAGIAALPVVEVLGQQCQLVEATGAYVDMAGNKNENFTLLGLVATAADHALFIKMTAPSDVAAAEREHFLEFCRSLRYGE